MINKKQFSIKDTKKILRKVGKQWVVVSAVLLGLATGGAVVNGHVTHAAVNNNQPQVTRTDQSAKHAYHLPQLNASQTNSLQNQAITSTVSNVSALKNRATATWDNAWDQKVTSDIEQTRDMSAKMNSLTNFNSYVASNEQQQMSDYGMANAYQHMPNGQSNADYHNYATASNALVSNANSMANSMITSMEHDIKVSNHKRQVANAPIHKQHAQVHAKEVKSASVSVKSASDQAKHDSAWAVRNGANDPAKSVAAAKSSANVAHSKHMSARAHAYKVASHTAMLKRKASNAVTHKKHATSRWANQTKSSADQSKRDSAIAKSYADQVKFNAAKSLRAGNNDPAKLSRAKRSTASSAFTQHKAIRAHNRKVAKHEKAMARKAHNDYLRQNGKSKGEIAQRNSQDSKNHRQRIADQQAHKHNLEVRAHAYKVASHTAMLKRKASNAVMHKKHTASRSANQTKSFTDQSKRDSAWAIRNGANDPAKLAHSNHAKSLSASQALVNKRAAAAADQSIASYYNSLEASLNASRATSAASSANTSIANSYSASVSSDIRTKDSKAKSNAIATSNQKIKDEYANSVSSSVSKANTSIANSYSNSVNASVSTSDKNTARNAASVADQSLESSIAKSYAQSTNAKIQASYAYMASSKATSEYNASVAVANAKSESTSISVSDSVSQSRSASTAKSLASSAASVKSSAEAAVSAGDFDPQKLSSYNLDNLVTIGYYYDGYGNEYTVPNILNDDYQMSGNEIYVKVANTNLPALDTGVYC